MQHSSTTPEAYEKSTHTGADHDAYIHKHAAVDGDHIYTAGRDAGRRVPGHPVIHSASKVGPTSY